MEMFDDLLDISAGEDDMLLLEPNAGDIDVVSMNAGDCPPTIFDSIFLPLPDDAILAPDVRCHSNEVPAGAGVEFNVVDNPLSPCDELDVAQLEWLSNFFDDADTFPPEHRSHAAAVPAGVKRETSFSTSSPVSVLENSSFHAGSGPASSSSSSSVSSGDLFSGISGGVSPAPSMGQRRSTPARPRSKRPRPTTFSAHKHLTVPILPPSTDAQVPLIYSDTESIAEPTILRLPAKKKKAAELIPEPDISDDGVTPTAASGVRRCTHCQIDRTPQWRLGPLGPKTLCNACGVRYKSGRLFPEYRPAASPTFVPSIHSNSHKKVVEMRLKCSGRSSANDLLNLIRRSD